MSFHDRVPLALTAFTQHLGHGLEQFLYHVGELLELNLTASILVVPLRSRVRSVACLACSEIFRVRMVLS